MTRLLLCVVASATLHAQIKFTRIDSPHFELYTDGAKGRAVEILEHFERVRSFFAQTINPRQSPQKPKIVVLNSRNTFAAFVERRTTAAYFIGLPHRDLIVIGPPATAEDQRIITHEYTHLLVHQADMRIPLWMNEGIAEVYSTLQPVGAKMRVGMPINSHLLRLRRDWLEIDKVLNAETYGGEEHAGTFYAMSWAIAHMMMLEDDLRVKWSRFLQALEKGMPAEQALKRSYGLTPQQLEQHVQGYIRGKNVNVVDFDFKWDEWKEKPQPRPATELENGLTMIDLHLSGKNREPAIRNAEKVAAAFPQAPEPWEALATAQLQEANFDGAGAAIRQAFEHGSTNPNLLARGASLTADRPMARRMLDRAIATEGENAEALLQLAAWHIQDRDYAAAFAAVRRVKNLSHADAPRFMSVYVLAAARSGNMAAAETAIKEFRSYAVSEKDKAMAEKLAAIVERNEAPEVKGPNAGGTAVGVLVEVACEDKRQVLHVATAAGPRQIPVDARQALLVAGDDVNVGCGPQKRKRRVRVDFNSDGLARKLEFLP